MIPFPDPVGYLAAPVLTATLLFAAAYVLGIRLAGWLRLELDGAPERIAVGSSLGLALLGIAGSALGMAGAFRPSLILALLATPAILVSLPGHRPRPVAAPPAPDGERGVRLAAWGIVAVLAAANFVRALYPPTGFDALNYQLPAVARYLADGRLGFHPDLRFAGGPALMPVLFVLAAAGGGELAVQLISFGVGLLAAGAVGAVAARRFGPTAGAGATALFYATPIVGWLSTEAYVDLGLVLFTAVALHAVLVRLDGGGIGWVAAAGLVAGAALGTRYLALLPVTVLALDLLTAPSAAGVGGARSRTAAVAAFLGVAMLASLPWYARNLAETGNPLFPLFNDVFHGRYWTAVDVGEHRAFLQDVGPGRGALDLAILPLRLSVDPAAFGGSAATGIGYSYLLLVPGALVRLRGRAATPALAAYGSVLGVGWFATSQQTRFLLPALAALAAIGGTMLQSAMARQARRRALPIAALSVIALGLGGTRWPSDLPPVGGEARDSWLQQHLPGYSRVQRVNERLPPDAVLYAFGQEGLRYHFRARTLGDWFGPTAYRRFLPADEDGDVWAAWRRLGVTHVLIDDAFPSRAVRAFRERPFWWDHLVPLASWDGVRLYELRAPPRETPDAPASTAPPGERGSVQS